MTRAALYTRVSTEEQAKEGFSLAAQMAKLRSYAEIHGWTITGEYVDEGQSGRTTKRPAYTRMMEEMGKWDVLVVLKMDRIHRNSRNFMAMMDTFEKEDKQFASVMESLDTSTAMGRFVADIIQRIAQLESDQNGERVLIAMEEKAKQGSGGLGGPAPYGYRWQDSKLVPEPEEATVVRAMHILRGTGARHIAEEFNRKGIKTRQGKEWTYWSVKAILENQVYHGHLEWNGILQRNTHEAIVEA